jgi:GNAT superfamily N-acetyltransferase
MKLFALNFFAKHYMIISAATSQQTTFSISSGVPCASRALIWEVFFTSRKRGFYLPTHFPWIEQNFNTYCLTLSENSCGASVATLVLRIQRLPSGSRYAMVGMVCVDQAWRGHGLSKRLISNALTFASEQQISSLLLWTTKPNIYREHGFTPDNEICDTFNRVSLNPLRPFATVAFTKVSPDASRGLPPFAKQLIRFESDAAELICVDTEQGMALAEWKGPLPAVFDLIESALPTTWNLNAPEGSQIFDEINRREHFCIPLLGAERMVRHLGTPILIPYISILERI